MKKIIVHVVGVESKDSQGHTSRGAFDWFYKKSDADKYLIETTKDYSGLDNENVIYSGEVEVDFSGENTQENRDNITEQVETFLMDNDWEKSCKKNNLDS